MAANVERPRVLVLGGTGFIGRNFVQYLVNNDLASKIRVADKVPPQMAWMNPPHMAAFEDERVEFKHANLINSTSVENAFASDSGPYDYVVNFAAETKYGQSEPVYHEGIVRLSENCAKVAAQCQVKMYVELSSGQMASSEKKALKEDGKTDPWTSVAQHKLQAERSLAAHHHPHLPHLVVRPAIVYGPGDRQGLTPRLIVGAIYRFMGEKMKLLWTRDLRMNTVHVEDVCRAVWFLLERGRPGEVYHVVDKSSTTQGKICQLVSQMFGIDYDFMGSVLSTMAKVNMSSVVEDINDKHMGPWADACQHDNIANTPLTPFIDQELLYNKHLHLDGSKLEQLGFHCEHPDLEEASLRQIVDDYVRMGLFPKCLLSGDVHYTPPDNHHLDDGGGDDEDDDDDNDNQ
ncbi:dTDP-glucose 4,6-dehydratase-like [Babylonia areolata]|uniref:dTDP-glucose 4,6-dehydratase-like n=1 Tax=Babylonia areolata TaxID=304850 RepID=UPI003FD03D82